MFPHNSNWSPRSFSFLEWSGPSCSKAAKLLSSGQNALQQIHFIGWIELSALWITSAWTCGKVHENKDWKAPGQVHQGSLFQRLDVSLTYNSVAQPHMKELAKLTTKEHLVFTLVRLRRNPIKSWNAVRYLGYYYRDWKQNIYNLDFISWKGVGISFTFLNKGGIARDIKTQLLQKELL